MVSNDNKIGIVLGTRPEIIKMSPIIRKVIEYHSDFFILHTGQHYSYNMDKVFFKQLNLPDTIYNLGVGNMNGSNLHGEQTARMLSGIENILNKEKPNIVLVQGDTNTVLAGALASSKLNIKVGHVEAGLRSYDRQMPEEINRVLTDHCSDYLFAPTEKSKDILIGEGINRDKIFVTGNTIVDAIYQNFKLSKDDIMKNMGLREKEYILLTIHRQENVDNHKRFSDIMDGIKKISKEFGLPIIYPIHPRSKKNLKKFDIKINGVELIEPLDFFNFLQFEANAKLILTDSGGIQEDSCILKVPCVTLRDNTERPETIEIGSNIISGTDPDNILECAKQMYHRDKKWTNPFGDGRAGDKIVRAIMNNKE